jgi:hypothetical protein
MAASNPSSKDERLARRGFSSRFDDLNDPESDHGFKALLAGSQDPRFAGFFGT